MPIDLSLGPITHVIFDFDGILIDSERQYSVANSRCLERWGCTFTLEMKAAMMGRRKEDAVAVVLEVRSITSQIVKTQRCQV